MEWGGSLSLRVVCGAREEPWKGVRGATVWGWGKVERGRRILPASSRQRAQLLRALPVNLCNPSGLLASNPFKLDFSTEYFRRLDPRCESFPCRFGLPAAFLCQLPLVFSVPCFVFNPFPAFLALSLDLPPLLSTVQFGYPFSETLPKFGCRPSFETPLLFPSGFRPCLRLRAAQLP